MQNGPAEFSVPIEADPGLTGQILKFVNSSYFGFAREISSIKMAITLVGIRTIKNFALWSAVFSLVPNPRCGPFDLKVTLAGFVPPCAVRPAAGQMAGAEGIGRDFFGGLAARHGRADFGQRAPAVYIKLLESARAARLASRRSNTSIFNGPTPRRRAGWPGSWNLPDDFAALIESHLEIEKFAARLREEPAKLAVALSALLPTIADPVWNECEMFESYYDRVVPSGPAVAEVLAQIDAEFAEFAPVMKLSTPRKSLVDCYHEVAAPSA